MAHILVAIYLETGKELTDSTFLLFPRSVHDSAFWKTSKLRADYVQNFTTNQQINFLIGDSGLPLEPWLLTPCVNTELHDEQRCNKKFLTARNILGRCGILRHGHFCNNVIWIYF